MSEARKRNDGELKPSLVPAPIAGILSLIIPGLGHILARAYQRGILLLLSTASILGLIYWRITIIGRRRELFLEKASLAFDLQPLLLVVTLGAILLILWIAYDAFRTARTARAGLGPFIMVLIVFFGLGWQIGEINLPLLAREVGKARYRLGQVMWPWDRAIEREPIQVEAIQLLEVPCDENPPPPNPTSDSEPYLRAEPTCGELTQEDGTPGTLLHLEGGNFYPESQIQILWQDPLRNEFRARRGGEYVVFTPNEEGSFTLDIPMPYRLIPTSAAGEALEWRVLARQVVGAGPAHPSEELTLSIQKMIETIFLGMMATFFGIILALPVSFLAAKNLMSASWITLVIYYLTRTVLNIVRSVEPLIWAVIAVAVVGLGPFAGIVALTLHSIAALGKLYSEAIESIDPGPIEAIQATGANWFQTVIYAVIPQIIPPFVSFTIYRWDINVRMSTVIGLVGGGGIGFLLVQWMRLTDFKAAGIAVWFIVITVAVLDFVSANIRERFV